MLLLYHLAASAYLFDGVEVSAGVASDKYRNAVAVEQRKAEYMYQLETGDPVRCLDANLGHAELQAQRAQFLGAAVGDLRLSEMGYIEQWTHILGAVCDDYDYMRYAVPGVGVYSGVNAAAEYVGILDYNMNGGFYRVADSQQISRAPSFSTTNTLPLVTTQHGVWGNDTVSFPTFFVEWTFRPCSLRVDGVSTTFSQESVAMFSEHQFSNRKTCERIQASCTGANSQYRDVDECVSFMDSLGSAPPCAGADVGYSLQGNTTGCRFLHHFMAGVSPEIHCPHVGKAGGPDLKGAYKCNNPCPASVDPPVTKQECSAVWRTEAEVAVVGALPSCLDALATGVCTEECQAALRQFTLEGQGLASDTTSAKQDLSLRRRACACGADIRADPRSAVLKHTGLDITVLLSLCGEMPPECEGTPFTPADLARFNTTDALHAIFKLISDASAASLPGDDQVRAYQADEDYLRHLLGGGFFSLGGKACPFYHGPLVSGYDEVLDTMRLAKREKGFTGYLGNPSPTMSGATADVPLGTAQHRAMADIIYDVFPSLAVPLSVSEPAPLLSSTVDALYGSQKELFQRVSKGKLTSGELIELITVLMYRKLLPEASALFVQQLAKVARNGSPFIKYWETKSVGWNKAAGSVGTDFVNSTARGMEDLLRSQLTDERYAEFESKVGDPLAFVTGSLLLGTAPVIASSMKLLQHILRNPCKEVKAFKSSPYNHVVEVLRLHTEMGGATLLKNGSYTMQHEGGEVTYTDAMRWGERPPIVRYSIYGANRDAQYFPDPETFDATRGNLDKVLAFGAPEAAFTGSGLHDFKACSARNFTISLLADVTLLLLPDDDELGDLCYTPQHQGFFDAAVQVCMLTALLFVCVALLVGACSGCFKRHYLDKLSENLLRCEPDESPRSVSSGEVDRYKVHVKGVSSWAKEEILLDDVHCSFEAGKLTGVMGHTGSGKTLLLDTISCQHMHVRTEGSIRDTSPSGSEGLRVVSYVKADPLATVYEKLTVCQNLLVAALLRYPGDVRFSEICNPSSRHGPSSECRDLMRSLVRSLKLEECLDEAVGEIGAGEKRRLAIAVECLRPSRVLLLDEPTTGLDSHNALKVVKLLAELARDLSKAIVLVVHQPSEEVFDAMDDLILMQDGRCIHSGTRQKAVLDILSDLEGGQLSNPADQLLSGLLKRRPSVSSVRENEVTDTPAEVPAVVTGFANRFLGCLLTLHLDGYMEAVVLFVGLLVFCWLICIGLAGGPSTPSETIALLPLLVGCTTVGYIAAMYGKIGRHSYRFCHLQSGRVVTGSEFYLAQAMWHMVNATWCTMGVFTAAMTLALYEYVDVWLLARGNALAVSAAWYTVCLMLTVYLVAVDPRQTQLVHFGKVSLYFTAFKVYTAFGWIMGGVYIRVDELSFKQITYPFTYTSVSYWASFSLVITVLKERVFGACAAGTLPEYLKYNPNCDGNTYLHYYNAPGHSLLPAAGVPALCLAAAFVAGLGVALCSKHNGVNLTK